MTVIMIEYILIPHVPERERPIRYSQLLLQRLCCCNKNVIYNLIYNIHSKMEHTIHLKVHEMVCKHKIVFKQKSLNLH